MISIRNSVAELERCVQEKTMAVECYRKAIINLAQYTIDLEKEITEPQRKYLTALADLVAAGTPQALAESQATLRGLLRDYRDKASEYLNQIREELSATARALEEILGSLAATDGDHEVRLRGALSHIRAAAVKLDAAGVKSDLLDAVGGIEESLEQMRKQHQLALAQFRAEIRILHKRIDALESATSVDQLTKLFTRADLEEQVRSAQPGYCLLLIRVNGFRLAEIHFGKPVAQELAGAFVKRLRNSLPPTAAVGRWAPEQFVALLMATNSEVITLAKWISESLAGAYACLQNGKTVRPTIQLTVAVVDSAGSTADRVLERTGAFLDGGE